MHTIAGITPNASERKCRANFVLTYGNSALTKFFDSASIISVNLIAEYAENSETEPVCELNVVLDNSDRTFDVTNKNNLYYFLSTKTTYGEIKLSTVQKGDEDLFLTKSKLQYNSISFAKNRVTLKFYDPFGFGLFDEDGMTRACNKTDGTARSIVDYVMETNNFAARCEISDDLNGTRTFSESNFQKSGVYMTQRAGLYRIAVLLGAQSGQNVICYMDDNGNLRYTYQKTASAVSETIAGDKYIEFRIEPPENKSGAAIGVFTDRGNILRELGDIVKFSKESEVYTMRIFRISYSYNSGVLTAENKGYIL